MANVCAPTRTRRLIEQLVVVLIAIGSGVVNRVGADHGDAQYARDAHQRRCDHPGRQFGHDGLQRQRRAGLEGQHRRLHAADPAEVRHAELHPANAVIQSARLYLVLKAAESSESRPLTAYHVTQSFIKGETNWYYFQERSAGPSRAATSVQLRHDLGRQRRGIDLHVRSDHMVQRTVNGEFGSRYTRVALIDTGGEQRRQLPGVPLHAGDQHRVAAAPRHHLRHGSATRRRQRRRPSDRQQRFA